jgi:membrane protease YdiL (CAAX protease family)
MHASAIVAGSKMIARSLSQFFAVALAALCLWFVVSAPDVVAPEFAGTIYGVFTLLLALLFGGLFVALRFATAGSAVFWSAGPRPGRQVGRIAIMIGTAITVQLSAGWIFEVHGRLEETAAMVGILTWTIIPTAFVASGLVEWPRRLAVASKRELTLVGAVGVCLAMTVSYARFTDSPSELDVPSVGGLMIPVASLIAAAAAEEVVFRVLLLTALLDLTLSRFHAVFLSSMAFGLLHAPLALMQPVVHADWSMLEHAAHAYIPIFLMQTLAGLCLGVLWLRTGSIGLVVLAHAIINVGPTMLTGL